MKGGHSAFNSMLCLLHTEQVGFTIVLKAGGSYFKLALGKMKRWNRGRTSGLSAT